MMDVDYIYCSNYFMMYMSDHYAVCLYTLFSVNYISIKLKEIGRKTIFIISKLLFAYPLILQKKERGKKKGEQVRPYT